MRNNSISRRSFAAKIAIGTALCLTAGLLVSCAQQEPDTVTYLVRHAEKVTGDNVGHDPALTPEGEARALALADLLKDKNINHIHSSDYIRTRDTAAPLAERTNLEVELYDPRDLPALAAKITNQGGVHVVVGHSNTTPEMSMALGGEGGTPIVEKTEYDRLYVISLLGDGTVHTDIKRYGAASPVSE